ncbi:MAG: hypothetical protein HQ495_09190 [Alphaproteobacteria bacterium]|nr:hypothetical protein [Alphaproteobacteria bacterium]
MNRLFGPAIAPVLILQAIVYALAAAYLAVSVARGPTGTWGGLLVALVVAFSPVQIGWPRFLLTESLALAGTLWVFAECLRSFDQKRFRTLPIAAAMLLALAARYDSILLALPVAAVGLIVERPLRAMAKGLVVFLIITTPIVAWTARNMSHGLSLVPNTFMKSGEPTPWGLLMWADTWVTSLYVAQFSYGIANRDYVGGRKTLDLTIFRDVEERKQIEALFDDLMRYQGQAFPNYIDDQFREMARRRRDERPFQTWLVVPLRRAAFLWGNPIHSFGLPFELDGKMTPEDLERWNRGGLRNRIEVASHYPVAVLGKASIAAYRLALSLVALALLLVVATRPWKEPYFPLVLGVGYAAARVLIIGFQSSLDSRYAIEGYAVLEVGVVVLAATWIKRRTS